MHFASYKIKVSFLEGHEWLEKQIQMYTIGYKKRDISDENPKLGKLNNAEKKSYDADFIHKNAP